MKVCFIAGTLGCGGAERQLLYMLRALKNKGIHTKLLCLTRGEKYEKEIDDLGVEIEWIGASHNRLVRLWNVINAVHKYRPDILQSSHFYTNIYSAAAGRFLGIANIGSIRNDVTSEIAANRLFGKLLLRLPQHLIANSRLGLERAVSRGVNPQKIDFLPNAVELKSYTNRDLSIAKKGINVIFVGRLVPAKRPELFIRLASHILQTFPNKNLTFQIIGDGHLRARLEELKNNYNLFKDETMFLGERSDMAAIYQNADIFVLTSEYEGTPNVVLEAMAFGIPVVATRVGGVPEILTEKSGILVDPSDFEGLVDATKKLIENSELRETLGRHGQNYVANNHSSGYMQKQLVGIYEKLLGRAQTND